jgi:hypothetical protein
LVTQGGVAILPHARLRYGPLCQLFSSPSHILKGRALCDPLLSLTQVESNNLHLLGVRGRLSCQHNTAPQVAEARAQYNVS